MRALRWWRRPAEIIDERRLRVEDYPGPGEAAAAFLAGRPVTEAVLAVATPVESEEVTFTNSPWQVSVPRLKATLEVSRLAVINDFVAQALAVIHLGASEREPIGRGSPAPGRAVGAIGPGTGLGVAGLVPTESGWLPLPSEGGHVSLAPGTARERAVLDVLARLFDHVSAERVLSGPGLLNLAQALAAIDGGRARADRPEDVSTHAGDRSCPYCAEAVQLFSAMLGAAAGDVALVLGARGGIYIVGGVCLNLGPLFDRNAFRARFVAKGRMATYLEPIPTFLVTRADTGLIGAAHYTFR